MKADQRGLVLSRPGTTREGDIIVGVIWRMTCYREARLLRIHMDEHGEAFVCVKIIVRVIIA